MQQDYNYIIPTYKTHIKDRRHKLTKDEQKNNLKIKTWRASCICKQK